MRLNKAIAQSGYCSRRKADLLIQKNAIKVNDVIISNFNYQVTKNDVIKVNDVILEVNLKKLYFLFNKPKKVISSHYDPQHRKIIFDYFKNEKTKLDFVGRLDYFSRGLMIITNDGELKQKLSHPRYHVKKIYHVKIKGLINQNQLQKLNQGLDVDGSKRILSCHAKIITANQQKNFTILEITLTEGKNRQIRKMLSFLHFQVQDLCRVQINNLILPPNLKPGQYISLTKKQIASILPKLFD